MSPDHPHSHAGHAAGGNPRDVPVAVLDGLPVPPAIESMLANARPRLRAFAARSLADALNAAPGGAPVLAVLSAPVDDLAARLARTDSPAAALAAWKTGTEETLAALHAASPQVVVIDRDGLVGDPHGTADMIGKRLDAALCAPGDTARSDATSTDPAATLVAALILRADPSARAVAQRAEAALAAVARPANRAPHDPEALWRACRRHRAALDEERELLRAHAATVSAARDGEAAETAIQRARADAAQRRAALADAESARREGVLARGLLGATQAIEANGAGRDRVLARALLAATGRAAAAEARIAEIHASRSWRLTAPLRRLRPGR